MAGQEKFRSLTSMYYRDSDGIILVFDIGKRDSFENLKNYWIKEITDKAPENVQIAVVGNKSDSGEKEAVTLREIQEFALQYRGLYKIVSAKKNQNLNDVF